MLLYEDAEFISYEHNDESPLDKLDLEEDFPKSLNPTCLLCNFDVTIEAYYFKDYAGPYCDVCFKYISDKLNEG